MLVGHSPNYPVGNPPAYFNKKGTYKEFQSVLPCEDTQDKDDWRLRIKGATS